MSAPAWLSAAKRRQLSGQSAPVGVAVGTAGPVEEMRRVEHEQVEPGDLGGEHRRLAAVQRRIVAARGFVFLNCAITAG